MKFQKAAQATARKRREDAGGDDGGNGIGGVMPAIGEFEGQGKDDYGDQEVEAGHRLVIGESSALDDDAFDYVGDVFAFVDGGFDDFKDFLPLDDLDGSVSSSKS